MKDRALLTIDNGIVSFSVYLPRSATPTEVGKMLAPVLAQVETSRYRPRFQAGEVMVEFTRRLPSASGVLVHHTESYLNKVDYHVIINYEVTEGWWAKVYRINNSRRSMSPCFNGAISELSKWPGDLGGLEDAIGKIVSFKYRGGSRPGKTRVVSVANIEPSGGSYLIQGTDLEKLKTTGNPDECMRNYKLTDIDGNITVLN